MGIEVLKGELLKDVKINRDDDDEIIFETYSGKSFKMYHSQDCCESVSIDDIVGDLEDIKHQLILVAEENTNNDAKKDERGYIPDSCTWTFYKIGTSKGFVNIRWYGESNGYYSESVDFEQINKDETND